MTRRTGSGAVALHVAVSRSAAVRLWPVAAALSSLGAAQVLLDLRGERPVEPGLPPELPFPGASAAPIEAAIGRTRPACVIVAGDGDASVQAALTASSAGVPIMRLDAGLRSGDRSDRREINRLVLDELATLLLADGDAAVARLRGEGAQDDRIRLVGSTTADTVRRWRSEAMRRATHSRLGVAARRYLLVSLRGHAGDEALLDALAELAARTPIVLVPVDALEAPARARLERAGATVAEGLSYLDVLALEAAAGGVLTNVGSVQEEATVLGVPCFTYARSSERSLTLTRGTNLVIGDDPAELACLSAGPLAGPHEPIPLWDGDAGRRVADELLSWSGR